MTQREITECVSRAVRGEVRSRTLPNYDNVECFFKGGRVSISGLDMMLDDAELRALIAARCKEVLHG